MEVRICSKADGLSVYTGVAFIRVRSKRFSLLIMRDYMPVLGELEGSLAFRTEQGEEERDHLHGYFMHKNNVFSLLLEDNGNPATGASAESAPATSTTSTGEADA